MTSINEKNKKNLIQKIIDFIILKILRKKDYQEDKKSKSKTDDIYPMW